MIHQKRSESHWNEKKTTGKFTGMTVRTSRKIFTSKTTKKLPENLARLIRFHSKLKVFQNSSEENFVHFSLKLLTHHPP